MDCSEIRDIPETCLSCELMLQHSSRSTGPKWLHATLSFYLHSGRKRVIQLGSGSEQDAARVQEMLRGFGFIEHGSRLDQEWQRVTFARSPRDRT